MSTFTPISQVTVTSSVPSVTFNNIPQLGGDLYLVVKGVSGSGGYSFIFNGIVDEGSYNRQYIYSSGTSAPATATGTNQSSAFHGGDGIDKQLESYIHNYSSNSTWKTVTSQTGNSLSGYGTADFISAWRYYDPITSLTVFGSGDWTSGVFTLYNITGSGAGTPKATGGNLITTDGSYWYHAFTSSGVFAPTQSITADYLIVAGGGGGGGQQGGGGGAGGVRAFSGQSFTAQNYTVTVGAGGVGGIGNANTGVTSGSNTTFNSTSVTGGGYGGSNGVARSAATGGSGGGGGINSAAGAAGNAGGYSPVEGYAGGATSALDGGAGGGGAGGAGTSKNGSGNGQNGGTGTNTYNSINFSTWLYATNKGIAGRLGGGGGGGTSGPYTVGSGSDGGGNGNKGDQFLPAEGSFGAPNTGGGGGGGAQFNGAALAGSGGSGIVIVRYAV